MPIHPPPRSRKRDRVALERRRRRAAALFRRGVRNAEVARRLHVTTAAVAQWKVTWRSGGLRALATKGATGPKPKLTPARRQRVLRALARGPRAHGYATDVWTLSRIARLIRATTDVAYHPGHVWYVLQGLGWSCQVPERRARERNERRIQSWVRTEWPRIQKRGQYSAQPSPSGTKPASAIVPR